MLKKEDDDPGDSSALDVDDTGEDNATGDSFALDVDDTGEDNATGDSFALAVDDTGEDDVGDSFALDVDDTGEDAYAGDSFALDVDDPGELLNPVEEEVALLDACLVLRVLTVRPVGDHNAANLVDLSMKTPVGNKPAELGVHVVLGHAEGVGHVLQRQAPVGLQQLSISLDLHLPYVEGVVGRHEAILFQHTLHSTQTLKEIRVLAVVQAEKVLVHLRNLMQNFENFTAFDNLLVKIRPVQRQHANGDGVLDKGHVVHQLVGGEGGDGVQKEVGRLLKVPHRHGVQSLVHLESVSAVPVPALLQHLLGLGDVGLDDLVVREKQADPNVEEDQVHPIAEAYGLFRGFTHALYGRLFVPNDGEMLRLFQEGFSQFRLPKVFFGVLDAVLQLLELLDVLLVHVVQQLLVLGPPQVLTVDLVEGGHIVLLNLGHDLLLQAAVVLISVNRLQLELHLSQLEVGDLGQTLFFHVFDRHFGWSLGNLL